MARKARVLTATERRGLQDAILAAIPESKGRAIPHRILLRRLRPHLLEKVIPVSLAKKHLHLLHQAKQLNISTRVGMWKGAVEAPDPAKGKPKGTLHRPNRQIRRIVGFVCTRCFRAFPSKSAAKEHLPVHAQLA